MTFNVSHPPSPDYWANGLNSISLDEEKRAAGFVDGRVARLRYATETLSDSDAKSGKENDGRQRENFNIFFSGKSLVKFTKQTGKSEQLVRPNPRYPNVSSPTFKDDNDRDQTDSKQSRRPLNLVTSSKV
mmetsp:Transcript_12911/g.17951  ORF Transcript_12911/g.17951 Transcript_12911/m.17951 type:complete len:130 (+) Transcript_12911:296-685(+)|eukprot:CAMPEP_0185263506 /NCGR_PEP_ID=MMETSP1359-20130426/15251_1 /TAXON_ID=552665 /ORGANISM="Bigelowiella longifila, Strain CCMP242" /LENGTH=129 /DNA_ID=CAMNT_0027851087 /DNA_START=296 /DNA_END=685 /DNA_ORIENTATION=+